MVKHSPKILASEEKATTKYSPDQKLVIIGIWPGSGHKLGLKQKCYESHVRISFSLSNLHNTTDSSIEIPEVGVQLPEWRVILHLYV